MNTQVARHLVTFPTPYRLKAMIEEWPAGVYEITTHEETLGDFVYEAYRRISTTSICRLGHETAEWAPLFRLILWNWRRQRNYRSHRPQRL
jgi:hypothetical protein